MSSQILLNDLPLVVTTPAIDPGTLAAINQAWLNNATQLGYFALAIGFVIGFISGYFYLKRKYGNV
jgi:vacuolar-type H+-ATPase subunit I/STV1